VGSNPLLPINLDRLIVDLLPKPFQLSRGMDGFPFSGVCILVEDGDNFATLSLDDGAGRNDGDINHLMVVNPLDDVNELSCLVNDVDISTRYATIGATINECTSSVGTVV
jgi:hypothetical protein